MRKLKKVISLTLVTAFVAAGMNMGNVQAMEAQNMGIQESVQKEVAESSNGEVVVMGKLLAVILSLKMGY